MRFPARKLIAALLVVVYGTTQVALGSATESNFWAERKRSVSVSEKDNQPLQLASLSSLPFQSLTDPRLPAIFPASSKITSLSKSDQPNFAHLSKTMQNIIAAVPLASANIQDVYDSKEEKRPPVVLIQDVHLNQEAQGNIAAVLQSLINHQSVQIVGVEGAFSAFDFEPFRSDRSEEQRNKINKLLAENQLAAPSFVGITSAVKPPPFVGVDDVSHYEANLRAYFESQEAKSAVTQQIESIRKDLTLAKEKYYSSQLRVFDDIEKAYHTGQISFGAYVKRLAQYDSVQDANLRYFIDTYDGAIFFSVEIESSTQAAIFNSSLNFPRTSFLIASRNAGRSL